MTIEPEDKFVRVGGINIRCADWGDNGPPMLLLHGDMRTSRSWDAVARDLRSKFHVVSMDSRGHGDSDWPSTGYRYEDRIEEVAELCDLLGLKGAVGVGHSTGGSVIALVADRYPGTFSNMALLEPVVVMDETFQRRIAQRANWARSTWSSRDELRKRLSKHPVASRWRDDVIEDVVKHEAVTLPDGKIDMKWAPETMNWEERSGDYFNLEPVFRAFGGPILFISSAEREAGFRNLKPLTDELESFQMVTLKNTNHNMYMERPDAVASVISDFMDDKRLPDSV